METILFLFSAGQDSIFLLYWFICQRKLEKISVLSINHCAQLNSQLLLIHTLRVTMLLQQKCLAAILKDESTLNCLKNENFFRNARYSLIRRFGGFYRKKIFLTAQTRSDLLETELIKFGENGLKVLFLPQSQKKAFVKKEYFKTIKKQDLSFIKKTKKKTGPDFSIQIFSSKKTEFLLKRPVQTIHRISTFRITRQLIVPIFKDLTNFNRSILRNKIRHYLLPIFYIFKKEI